LAPKPRRQQTGTAKGWGNAAEKTNYLWSLSTSFWTARPDFRSFATHCTKPTGSSHINLLRDGKGIINLDAEVSDGTFDLGMAERTRVIMHPS
jgi:hypothetical protein